MAGRDVRAFKIELPENFVLGQPIPDLNTAGAYRVFEHAGKQHTNVCCPCGCGKFYGFEGLPQEGKTVMHIEYGDHLWAGGLEDGMWVEDVDAKPTNPKPKT